ncbi:MAG: hypothetical protein QM770_24315 [Tepidisphaeraceae bacterium]
MSKGEQPVFRVSAGTAFKAGFFGAMGFLVGQALILGVGAFVLVGVIGFSLTKALNQDARWQTQQHQSNIAAEPTAIELDKSPARQRSR